MEADTAPTFPDGTAKIEQIYVQNTMIPPLTLPTTATGGNGALTYTLTDAGGGDPDLQAGLTFNAAANPPTITGTPTEVSSRLLHWRAIDADDNELDSDTAILRVGIAVDADLVPAFAAGVTIADQRYLPDEMVALTLPEATIPGNGATTYGLDNAGTLMAVADGESVLGLTWNAADRTLTGTPTAGTMPFFWIARDTDGNTGAGDTASLGFRITVEVDTAPAFATGETIDLKTYVTDTMIAPLTFPQATGGNGDLTYMLTPSLPAGLGLTFDGAARPPTLTGTPTAATASVTYTYTAADADGNIAPDDTASLAFDITVAVDTAPTFPEGTVKIEQIYVQNVLFPTLTLPTTATGGNGALTYALTNTAGGDPDIPDGLTFNANANPPTITGTPTEVAGRLFHWRAIDADDNELDSDTAIVRIGIAAEADRVPAFAEGVTIADQTYLPGETVALTLPAATIPGNGATTYRLVNMDTVMVVSDGESVLGLTYNAAERTLTGTATAGDIPFFWIAQDTDGNTIDITSLAFDITVAADIAPTFADNAMIPTQTYIQNTMIPALTFPQATGGNGDFSYTLTPNLPAGLTFDGAARPPTLTGTPPAVTNPLIYTYTAADADSNMVGDDTASLTFDLTVEADTAPTVPDGTVTIEYFYVQNVMIPPLTLPTTATGGNGALTYTLTNSTGGDPDLQAGLTFNADANPPTITGTPTEVRIKLIFWVATDADDNKLDSDTAIFRFGIAVEADATPAFAEGVTIADQRFLVGEPVALTLPAATIPGNGATTYVLDNAGTLMAVADGESVLGLTYNAADRTLIGTATVGTMPFFWIARDADGSTTDMTSLGFRITVAADIAPAFADNAMIPEQIYIQDLRIPTLVFPQAIPGNVDLTYMLTPNLPAGLTFDGAARPPTLTGTPPAATNPRTYTYAVADTDSNMAGDDTASLTFDLTVAADTAPTFPDGTVITDDVVSYIQNTMITPLTLPTTATGGNGALTYTLTPNLPAGLTWNADADPPTITGTPTATAASLLFFWVVTDADDNELDSDTASLNFAIAVEADLVPAFAEDVTIADQLYLPGETVALTLPEATIPGNGATTYRLINMDTVMAVADGESVLGLTFDAADRTLTGTATAGDIPFFWIAQDADGNTLDITSLAFDITVAVDIAPTFADNAMIPTQGYIQNTMIPALTFPQATSGNGDLTYTLTPSLPAGLTFDGAARPPTLIGTPTVAADSLTYSYTAADADSNMAGDDTASLMFDLTVAADTAPTFPNGTVIPRQTYTQNTMITPLTLPTTATGGNGALTYALTGPNGMDASELPAGLTFNAAANPPTITGTPTGTVASLLFHWVAMDADDTELDSDSAMLSFAITIEADRVPAFAEDVTIAAQRYLTGEPVALTLPAATITGNGATTYRLVNRDTGMAVADGESVLGLTWNAADRTLTGMPTVGDIPFFWIVQDADGNTGAGDITSLAFDFTVAADTAPVFADNAMIPTQGYIQNTMIPTLIFPQATTGGGDGDVTYMLTPRLPAGLTFDGAARPPTLTGTPTAATDPLTYTYTAADTDSNMAGGDTASLTVDLTVVADIAPTFPDGTVITDDVVSYIQNTMITPLTLPTTATGGNGALTYALTDASGNAPNLPAGLTYNAAANPPTLTGTPTATAASLLFFWVAMDADGNELGSDTASLNFAIAVEADLVPAFAEGVTIADPRFFVGETAALTLPEATIPGNGATTYGLVNTGTGMAVADRESVLGLTWNAARRTLTGTATVGTISLSWIARDADGNTGAGDTTSLAFDLTVDADTAPAFAIGETVDLRTYVAGTMIAPLTFPQATGGNGDLTYMLTPSLPAGLTFDGAARPPTLTGTPTAATASVTYTYTAADADDTGDDTASLAFDLTVEVDTAPTFPDGTVVSGDVAFAQNVPFPTLTLPRTATGGNGPLTYALTHSSGVVATLQAGLTFNAAANPPTITGTPTQLGAFLLFWVAIDADDNELLSDTARVNFVISIQPDIVPAFAEGVTIADQFYLPGEGVALTLPAAAILGNTFGITFGPDITYGLVNRDTGMAVADGESVLGLTWNAAARTLLGTTTLGTIPFSLIAQDADENTEADDTASLEFDITVASIPVFTNAIPTAISVAENETAVGAANLFAATPAIPDHAPVTLSLSGADDDVFTIAANGTLTFNDAPDFEMPRGRALADDNTNTYTLTVTATDNASMTTTADLTVSVSDVNEPPGAPVFSIGAPTPGSIVIEWEPPANTGPPITGYELTYEISGGAPATVTIGADATTYILTGLTAGSEYAITLSARNDEGMTTSASATATTPADTLPAFAADVNIPAQLYTRNALIAPLTLPSATGGNGALTYALTPALPAGLSFDAVSRTLTGVPTELLADARLFTFTVEDTDGDTASAGFTITVNPAQAGTPAFADDERIADQTFVVGQLIAPLTLPAVMTGGDGATIYALTPPAGLTFNAGARVLSGTPTTAAAATTYLYMAGDTDGSAPGTDETSLAFRITVEADTAPAFADDERIADQTFVVGQLIAPLTLPETTAGNGATRYALTGPNGMDASELPDGLTYTAADRTLTGTPTTVAATTTYTWTASDSDANTAAGDMVTLTFGMTVAADTAPAFAAGETIADQAYIAGQMIAPLTLPEAAGGNGVTRYTLTLTSLTSLAGLTFDAGTRVLSGTATTEAEAMFTYTAGDSDANTAADDMVTLTFGVTVAADTAPAFGESIADQIYDRSIAIEPLTLPEATGGNGALIYMLTPITPGLTIPGLTFDPTSRVLSGTPTTPAVEAVYTYSVRDSDANNLNTDRDIDNFRVTVNRDSAPEFRKSQTPDDQIYEQNIVIEPLTLPAATTGGNGAIFYMLTPTIPGLTFDPTSRVLSGAPTAAGAAEYRYRARDSDTNVPGTPDTTSLSFTITVTPAMPDMAPAFAANARLPDQTYYPGQTIDITLPTATGGNGPISYTLTGPNGMDASELPAGLTWNAADRTISGAPSGTAEAIDFTWTATDSDVNNAAGDMATLTFSITVSTDRAPEFAAGVSIANQLYLPGRAVAQALPGVVPGSGNVGIVYALTPALPAGLSFEDTRRPPALRGTAPAVFPTTTYTYTATDTDANTAESDTVSLTFTITVETDTAPTFVAGASIPFQQYTQYTTITPVTFPVATGGNGPLTYTLTTPTMPPGLTFNGHIRPPTLTGTPTVNGFGTFTYRVTDADNYTATGDMDMLTFQFQIVGRSLTLDFPAMVGIGFLPTTDRVVLPYPVDQAITPTTLPAVTGGTAPYIYSRAGPLPVGLTFDANVRVLSGTPRVAGVVRFRYQAADAATPAGFSFLNIQITICDRDGSTDGTSFCFDPTFVNLALPPLGKQTVVIDEAVTLTLPEATGGNGDNPVRIYTATPLPAGLTFDPTSREITGTPTTLGTTTVSYRVGDAGNGNIDGTTGTFNIVVIRPDTAPAFAADATIADQAFTIGEAVALTLPGVTPGTGDIRINYAITPALPAGLTFDADTLTRTITGTPIRASRMRLYTYTVTDGDTNAAVDDTDMLTFQLSVAPPVPLSLTEVDFGTFEGFVFRLWFPIGQPIIPITLPTAFGGTPPYSYDFGTSNRPPDGLTFDADFRVLSGTPTRATNGRRFFYEATDDATSTVYVPFYVDVCETGGTVDGLTPCRAPTIFFIALPTPPGQAFALNEAIAPVTLPAATGGTGTNSMFFYTLTPDIPGLTFDPATRVLTGTPTTPGATSMTYSARDQADSTDSVHGTERTFFALTVGVDSAPAFAAGETIADQIFISGEAVALTLPTVITGSGDATIIYVVTPALPPGLILNDLLVSPTITGTPTDASPRTLYTYTATDGDTHTEESDSDSLTFRITVPADTAPAFAAGETIADQTFLPGETVALTLPTVIGGTGNITVNYALTPALPAGLTFDGTVRPPTLTGTAATALATTTFTYTATDGDANTAPSDSGSLAFTITVEANLAPIFAEGVAIDDQLFLIGETVALTLPTVTGKIGIDYALTPALPVGLTFDAAARPPTITGTAATALATTTFTYTATGTDANIAPGDSDSLAFTITVEANTAPTFATGTIPAQAYPQHTVITPLTFPQATGGNGALTYTLTGMNGGLPIGLTFDGTARPPTLTGRPVHVTGAAEYAYKVTDADGDRAGGDTATRTFQLSVTARQVALDFPAMVGIGTGPEEGSVSLYYPLGRAITPTTFPAAIGGIAPYAYSTGTGLPPPGLTFDADSRVLSGTPILAGENVFQYQATDSAAPTRTTSVDARVVVCEIGGATDGATLCAIPTFVALSFPTPPENLALHISATITPLTLPAATGGFGANPVRIYTATPLPAGLTFDPFSRAITGSPGAAGATTVRYRVGDAGSGNTDARSTTVMFDIVVIAADSAPTFAAGVMIAVQNYDQHGIIPALTFPQAAGGNGALTYMLTPALPAGLTFDAAARPPTLTGRPVVAADMLTYTYTAADADDNTAGGDIAMLTFPLSVSARRVQLSFPDPHGIGAEPGAGRAILYYPTGRAITPVTFPEAFGSIPPYTYSYSGREGPLPAGLTFNAATRVLSGTPTLVGIVVGSYIVEDSDLDPGSMEPNATTLNVIIVGCEADEVAATPDGTTPCAIPTFVALNFPTPPANQTFGNTRPIVPLTLPAATGGTSANPTHVYTATPLPAGLTFDPTSRVMTGTPTTLGSTTVNYRVGDATQGNANTQSITVTFDILVEANTAPAFAADATILPQSYFIGQMFDITLPAATAGNGDLAYRLTGPGGAALAQALPGASLNPTTRVLSGMLTGSTVAERVFTYTVTDRDGDTAAQTFTIEVFADSTPAFAAGETIADQTFLPREAVALTLPTVTGGTGNITIEYALTPNLPAGLTFNAMVRPPTITGTPPTARATMTSTHTYTATDADGNTEESDSDSLEFDITVEGDTAPTFAAGAVIPLQLYVRNTMITPLTLPLATGGMAPLTYMLTPSLPAGLTFNAAANPPTLTGTPTETTGSMSYHYRVTDADDDMAAADADSLFFTIRVSAGQEQPLFFPSTSGIGAVPNMANITLYYPLGRAITPTTFSVAGGGTFPYTYSTADGSLPVGLTFDAEVRVLSGLPTLAGASGPFSYTVTDSAMPPATDAVDVTIVICDTGGAADGATVCAIPTFMALSFPTPPPANQVFDIGTSITPLTLPAATGGTGANPVRLYTAAPLPDGLTFDPISREITGSPGAAGTTTVRYRVGDASSGNTDDRSTTVTFDIVVADGPFLNLPADQTYIVGQTVALTLPVVADGTGTGTLTYTLTGVNDAPLPAGLTWNMGVTPQTITGTTTAVQASTSYNYAVTDSLGLMSATVTFRLTVNANIPVFTNAIPTAISVAENETEVGAANLFAATPATPDRAPVTLSLSGADDDVFTIAANGTLTFNDAPDFEMPRGRAFADDNTNTYTLTVTATDNSSMTTTADLTVSVSDVNEPPGAPVFSIGVLMSVSIVIEWEPPANTGPPITGYELTYEISGGAPATVTIGADATTYILTGLTAGSEYAITLSARNDEGMTTSASATATTPADTLPAFAADDVNIPAQQYTRNALIAPLTLPSATGGNGALTYALTPALPAGLTFDAASRTLTGVPTELLADARLFTFTVEDTDGDTASAGFTITVNPAQVGTPAFADDERIDDQTFVVGQLIVPLTLPAVMTAGDGATTYALTPPAGLTFNAGARVLSGAPTTAAAATTYLYMAGDTDGSAPGTDETSLAFRITVEADTAPAFAAGETIADQFYIAAS